ncbi:MAG TPA: hypothetical protein PLF81_15370 [Candidatus Anammoximicrobium sp.]|nr:hypothetical protein [Candidatus Anammoximicrobium sp.]
MTAQYTTSPAQLRTAGAGFGLLAAVVIQTVVWWGCGRTATVSAPASPPATSAAPTASSQRHPATEAAATAPPLRHRTLKVIAPSVDPYEQLERARDALRTDTAVCLRRIVSGLPSEPATRFDRLRRISGEEYVLRELQRWLQEPPNAPLLTAAERAELSTLERRWRDWESALTHVTQSTEQSQEQDHDAHES